MNVRQVQTKMWRDEWFVTLSQQAKLTFVYLFTNEYIGLSGMYELSDRQICFDTGLTPAKLEEVKQELYPKVVFSSGWVYLTNAEKHDPIKGENNPLLKTKQKELERVPDAIRTSLQGVIDAPSRGHRGGIDAPQGIGKEEVKELRKGGVGGKHPSVDDLTQEVIEKIAADYSLPIPFVTSKADDLKNWCLAKGKSYRDYPAALRNWVKKDAERIVTASKVQSKSFDATEGGTHELTV